MQEKMSTLTKGQRTIVTGSFLGWSLDGYDIVLMLLVISSVSPIFFPSEDPIISLLGTYASYSVTLIMRPLGAAIFGIYGDKFGRKKSMIITILGFSIATFVTGLLPTYAMVGVLAPILLILTRMIQGIFAGGEWGSGAVITMESVPKQKRGLLSGFLQSGFSCNNNGKCTKAKARTLVRFLTKWFFFWFCFGVHWIPDNNCNLCGRSIYGVGLESAFLYRRYSWFHSSFY